MNNPKISVVVPTVNRLELLKKCLSSLLSQTFKEYEIIIINDGSKDGTKEYLDEISTKKKIIKVIHQNNQGFGNSRNKGFKMAKGEFIASTDDDCVVENDWLEKIIQGFKSDPKNSAVGGSIINPSNSRISWAQYILNYSSWFPSGKPRFVDDIPTSNITYRKSSIKNMKFNSKNKKAGYSDTMFNLNLRESGGNILFDPNIKVYHHRWEISASEKQRYKEFLGIQERKALGFLLGGYKAHGTIGKALVKIKFLNFFCPRLLPVFWRCLEAGYFSKFVLTFPFLLKGELEFARTIFNS